MKPGKAKAFLRSETTAWGIDILTSNYTTEIITIMKAGIDIKLSGRPIAYILASNSMPL